MLLLFTLYWYIVYIHIIYTLAIHTLLGRSWLVWDTSLGPTAQGWGAEQEWSGSELDFPEWRRVGAEKIKKKCMKFIEFKKF